MIFAVKPKGSDIATNAVRHVAGVFAVAAMTKGVSAEVSRTHRGTPELVQNRRVVAVSESLPQLLTFAHFNGLEVKNYADVKEPKVGPLITIS